jgi:hypothetical protein
MHKLKEKFMDELYALEEKAEKSNARINDNDLNKIHKLTDTIKNIDKIEMLEDGGGYSEESDWMADGRMYGTSYDEGSSYARGGRGRGRNAKRDSMGRYSSEGGSYRGGSSYEGGMSYERGGRGGYSRDGGKEEVMELLDEAMSMADSETKHKIRRFKKELEED